MIVRATGVAVGGRAVLIAGPPGSGKSTLALALIDRGATLIGDDAVTLEHRAGGLVASPPPRARGLIEIRNVGLGELPCTSAPAALWLRLDPDAPRFIQQSGCERFGSFSLPAIAFDPGIAQAPIRAEWALRLHGLPAPCSAGAVA